MDQHVIAGVGNVYRAEVLFRHRIHPLRPGRTLRRGRFEAMWTDLVGPDGARACAPVGSTRCAPSTCRRRWAGRRARDRGGGEVYVYRRTGLPCLVCGTRVRADVLVGRNLFWCSQCQSTFRSRALQ